MWNDLAAHAAQHLALAGSALALALAAGVPLGILASRGAKTRAVVLAFSGVGRTVPSIAVLMLLLPLLGVGAAPAVAALTLLAIPPIAINVDLAIRGVPAAMLDAADGMGMTARQRFARVVFPLSIPVSLAGVRIAATESVASATLATFVGAGGLGDDIVRGLQTNDAAPLYAGAVTVALLALATELLLGGAGRLLEART